MQGRPAFGSVSLLNDIAYLGTNLLRPCTPTLEILSRPTQETISSNFRTANAGYIKTNFSSRCSRKIKRKRERRHPRRSLRVSLICWRRLGRDIIWRACWRMMRKRQCCWRMSSIFATGVYLATTIYTVNRHDPRRGCVLTIGTVIEKIAQSYEEEISKSKQGQKAHLFPRKHLRDSSIYNAGKALP